MEVKPALAPFVRQADLCIARHTRSRLADLYQWLPCSLFGRSDRKSDRFGM